MRLRKAPELVGLVACLILWPVSSVGQENGWKDSVVAAAKAHNEGQYAEAERILLAALPEVELFGKEDPRLAAILNNLATAYYMQYKFTKARKLCKRSLTILINAYGPDHLEVARSLSNLAMANAGQRKSRRAVNLYKRSLAIMEKSLGPNHPDVVRNRYRLKVVKAEASLKRARRRGFSSQRDTTAKELNDDLRAAYEVSKREERRLK